MGYEIPKNLKYEEKILFNLSLWQAGWLGIFGLFAAMIFLKTALSFEIKSAIAIILALAGAGFAFFDLKEHVASAGNFILKPREIGYLDGAMQKFTEVKKIGDDAIYLGNGTVKAIIQVHPINFHILSQQQQKAIISAYRDFLNSLDFPIQIVMRTVNLSLDDYLERLGESVNMQKSTKIQAQFIEFREFMRGYIEQNAVKNRLFYMVIPADSKISQEALRELEIREKLCREKLRICALVTKRLGTNELVSMLSGYFEGFVETGNEYISMLTLLEKSGKNMQE